MITISLVVPMLNKREFLPGLIQNVLANQANDLVLVDGGSTDGTQDYIKRINNPNISLIQAEKDQSWPTLMNLGIKYAKNEIICPWSPEALLLGSWETVYRTINNSFDIYVFSWKNGTLRDTKDVGWLDAGQFKDGTSINGWKYSACVNYGIYRKRVFRMAGLYHEGFTSYYADNDMTQRALVFGFTNRIKIASHIQVADLGISKTGEVSLQDQYLFDALQKQYTKEGSFPKEIKKLT